MDLSSHNFDVDDGDYVKIMNTGEAYPSQSPSRRNSNAYTRKAQIHLDLRESDECFDKIL